MRPKPSEIFATLITILLPAFLLLFAPAPLQAKTVLTLANFSAPGHPREKACQYFAKAVKTKSRGRITIDMLPGASLGDDAAMVRALQDGTLDITANSQGAVSAVVPEYNAFGMPFLFSKPEQAWRLLDGPVGKELARRSANKGLVVLGFWDNGIRQISNSVHPIRSPADVAGLRIRTPPDEMTIDIVKALGARPVQIRFSDIYNALLRGIVDGQENPLVNFQGAKLYEVQKYISLTGHKYEITPFLIRRAAWEALAPADRAILKAAANEATRFQRSLTRKKDEEAFADLVAHGVQIEKVDTQPFIAATRTVYKKWYASPIGDYVRSVVQAARAQM